MKIELSKQARSDASLSRRSPHSPVSLSTQAICCMLGDSHSLVSCLQLPDCFSLCYLHGQIGFRREADRSLRRCRLQPEL